MSAFEIIAAVLLSVLQCAAFLLYGPRLIQRMAEKLHDIITATGDYVEGKRNE